MVAKLVAEEGYLKGLVLSLEEGDSWVIGRDPDACQLVVEDPLTSRKHLIARRTSEGISVENLSQTNPIQVNEEEIQEQPRLLQHGDTVKIGSEIFRFYTDTSAHVIEDENNVSQEEPAVLPPQAPPASLPPLPVVEEEDEDDTIFDADKENTFSTLAEINFGLNEVGRWLLKVVSGPNSGAEFYMQAGQSYVIGTDPHSCDIVFHDTSVSRQHARLTVTEEDHLLIEDLKSRNGILVNNQRIDGKQSLPPSVIVTMGTTAFVVYDREGEMQTIISPLLPSIVKVLQQEESVREEKPEGTDETLAKPEKTAPEPQIAPVVKQPRNWGSLILSIILIGLFSLVGIATYSLFKAEPVVQQVQENANELIQQVIAPFPAIKFSYNKASGSLLLLGHVVTQADKNQLIYNLQGLNFIKSFDDSGLIIDELVWREINSVLARNPAWQGINIHSPAAGQFVLSGYLQTRKQAEQLSDYLSINFPYLDLLKNQIVVEEDVLTQIGAWLQQDNLRNVTPKVSNGDISLTGSIPGDKTVELDNIIQQIKEIQGVRSVTNLTRNQAPEQGIVNISDQYEVTGRSKVGDTYTVILNGRIVSQSDIIDGMVIKRITANTILLEKDGTRYRIDYNQ